MEQFAAFEVIFSAAAAVMTFACMGLPSLIPYWVLEANDSSIILASRKMYNVYVAFCILATAIVCMCDFRLDVKNYIILLIFLSAALYAQRLLSACFQTSGRRFVAPILEHLFWLVIIGVSLISAWTNRSASIGNILTVTILVTLSLTILVNAAPIPLARPLVKGRMREYVYRGMPVALSEVAVLFHFMAPKTLLLLLGLNAESATTALASRYAAPIIFLSQTVFLSGMGRFFQGTEEEKRQALWVSSNQILFGALVFAVCLIYVGQHLEGFPDIESFSAVLVLNVSMSSLMLGTGSFFAGNATFVRMRSFLLVLTIPLLALLTLAVHWWSPNWNMLIFVNGISWIAVAGCTIAQLSIIRAYSLVGTYSLAMLIALAVALNVLR